MCLANKQPILLTMQIDMDVKLNTDFHKWLNVASSFLLYLFVDSVLLSFQGGDNELAWYINEKDTCLQILEYLSYFFQLFCEFCRQ